MPLQQLSSSGGINVPAFDPSLGTLKDLQLSLTITGTSTEFVYNSSGKLVGFKKVGLRHSGFSFGPRLLGPECDRPHAGYQTVGTR